MRNSDRGIAEPPAPPNTSSYPANPQSEIRIPQFEILDLLSALVDKSLVMVDEGEGGARYRMLETIQQYARERLLERGEAKRVRDRHAEFFLALAQAGAPHLRTGDQRLWLARLDREHSNLRAALEWFHGEGIDGCSADALRLTAALTRYWYLRAYLTEGRARMEAVLSRIAGDAV